jgi:hypothetical protein
MRFRVEHFRAIDVPDSALGVEYIPTGEAEELDAPDEAEAAAIALSTQRDVAEQDDVSYDPSHGLYGLAGEDEAVRVTTVA